MQDVLSLFSAQDSELSRQRTIIIGPFRISQVLGCCIFIACVGLLIYFYIKKPYNDFFKYDSKYKKKVKK